MAGVAPKAVAPKGKGGGKVVAPKVGAPGAGAPGGGLPYVDPNMGINYNQLNTIANQQAQQELLPQRQALTDQERYIDAQNKAGQNTLAGYYQAAADMAKGVGTETSNIYNNAASNIDHFSSGIADGVKLSQQQQLDAANKLLGIAGAPSAQGAQVAAKIDGAPVAQVLQTTGGYIPGSTLATEGAAFGAAAANLPNETMGRGAQAIKQLALQGIADRAQAEQKLQELEAQSPMLANQIRSQLFSNAIQGARYGLEANKLNYEINRNSTNDAFNREYKTALIDLRQKGLISQDQYRQAMIKERQNSQQSTNAARYAQESGYFLGPDGKMHPTVGEQRLTLAQKKAAAGKSGSKGLTPEQQLNEAANAETTAETIVKGYTQVSSKPDPLAASSVVADGAGNPKGSADYNPVLNPGTKYVNTYKPAQSYQEMLNAMTRNKVSRATAEKVLVEKYGGTLGVPWATSATKSAYAKLPPAQRRDFKNAAMGDAISKLEQVARQSPQAIQNLSWDEMVGQAFLSEGIPYNEAVALLRRFNLTKQNWRQAIIQSSSLGY